MNQIVGAPRVKVGPPYKPLTQKELDFIKRCYDGGLSARKVAPLVPCSQQTAWKCYRLLRNGEILRVWKAGPQPKNRALAGDPDGGANWRNLVEKWEKRKSKKPLINEARFYKSNFEPA